MGFRLTVVAVALVSSTINPVFAQSITITDEGGTPLELVQVYDDDFSVALVSDDNGEVSIRGIPDSTYLNFSYIGYVNQRISCEELRRLRVIVLQSSISELETVEVIGRRGRTRDEIVQRIETITRKEISFKNPQTSVDAIEQSGNLFVQRSQMGGGSPIIRGFEANKILLVVDGVRMNNAIYRNGHLQNAITVGGSILERIEVIYGPGSVHYGSDALGGVIHFRTRDPELAAAPGRFEIDGGALLRYASANTEKTGQFDFSLKGHRLSSLTSFSVSDYGDLVTGNRRDDRFPDYGKREEYQVYRDGEDRVVSNPDPNEQIGTAFRQYDFLQKLRWQPTDKLLFIGNFQYSTSSDVPRYDNLTERRGTVFRWGEWYYGPQKRLMASVKANWFSKTPVFDDVQLIVAFQDIAEDRITRGFGDQLREYQEEDVAVWTLTADFNKAVDRRGRHVLEYGLDFQHDNVVSVAFSEDIETGQKAEDILTRYPDGSSGMRHIGGYLEYEWKNPRTNSLFEGGLRISNAVSDIRYESTDVIQWPEEFTEGVSNSNTAVTGTVSWKSRVTPWLRYRLMASSAYRVPNIDDLAKIRVRGRDVLVPNLDLEPERSYTFEATLSQVWNNLIPLPNSSIQFDVTGYYTRLTDAIIRSNYQLPNGDTLLEVSGEEYRVQANINAESAWILGASLNLLLKVTEQWTLTSSFNALKGRSTVQGDPEQPLAHIPPNYGTTGLRYTADKWQAEFAVRYNGKKPIDEYAPASSDNEDFATPVGALAWTTLNLYGAYHVNEHLSLNLGVENIANLHYRTFSSGVSAPGRNIVISASGRF